jgi:4-aminobutyrate aminotransferase/(S)-3-amino-2-methylpropionate transaminase
VIVEPVIGEGGFLVPPPAFLDELLGVARAHGALIVADEIQTGFARTGRMFGSQYWSAPPDLVCLAKSLSSGLPLSAVVGRAELLDAPVAGGLGGTFGGNPVACAAALGTLDTIEAGDLVGRANALGNQVAMRFAGFRERFSCVGDARGLGAMRAIELVKDRTTGEPDGERVRAVLDGAAQRGLLLLSAGLHGNVIRTLMPLVMSDEELGEALDVLEECLAAS